MSLLSRILARVAKLPSAETYHIAIEKHLEVPMPDGVVLLVLSELRTRRFTETRNVTQIQPSAYEAEVKSACKGASRSLNARRFSASGTISPMR